MRCCRALALGCCVLLPAFTARADETFPYKAYVSADDVYVRSGPGKNYYPTDKLGRGSEVEVYRHDPGGWFAIRPPEGSFSWVASRNVRPIADRPGVVEVIEPQIAALVGSRFSDVRDVRQVHLDRGEQLEILGEKRFVGEGNVQAETWYRVAPPAGEFRWVFGRFVTRQGEAAPIAAKNPAQPRSTTTPAAIAATTTDPKSPAHLEPEADTIALASHAEPVPAETTAVSLAGNTENHGRSILVAARETAESDARAAGEAREVITIPEPKALGAGPADPLQTELDDLNLKLSLMIAEEPSVWQFDALRSRASAALTGSRTALQRGRAAALLREIEHYDRLRRQYAEVAVIRQQTERQNEILAEAADAAAGSIDTAAAELARYDGVGRLTPVASRRPDAPRYALTDARGGVVTFVTPDRDLALHSYVGRIVGLNGVKGFMPGLGKPHLTAKRLTELDQSVMR